MAGARLVLITTVLMAYFSNFCECQITLPSACPNITPVQDFKPTNYLGLWYEQQKYFSLFQFAGRCVTANYTDAGNGKIGIVNSQKRLTTETITGEAVPVNPSGTEAKYSVSFPSTLGGFLSSIFPSNPKGNYWVLDTDYTSYSIVWSCENLLLNAFNNQFLWVLTRERFPAEATINTARNKIASLNLTLWPLHKTDQQNCS